jgi:SAM-dependent methyltransferase
MVLPMLLDQQRIRAILTAKHSYYGAQDIPIRKDMRWYPGASDLIVKQLSPTMRVLDVGCGNGELLLDISSYVHTGIGIDNDPEHIQLAQAAKHAHGINNVNFLLLDFPDTITQLHPESFDMLVSLRGPVPDTSQNLQAALHLLRPGGLLFCEVIAERHQHEVRGIFGDHSGRNGISMADQISLLMEQNGFNVRLASDVFTKWVYPDVYAWLQYQCNIWTWLGIPLPEPDDPRIGMFAEQQTIATGEIETTHHVAWVAGVKS